MQRGPRPRNPRWRPPLVAKHIGIVAVSPEGAALCYRQIFRQAARLLPPDQHPRVSVHNEPLAQYIAALREQNWHVTGTLLRRSAELLARCGAQFCLTPDNAVQHAVHLAEVGSPVPWLTMTDLVARAVEADKRRVVGLIGTKLVMSSSTYQTYLGLKGVQLLTPSDEDADALEGIIFSELIYGRIRTGSQRRVLAIVERLADRGCEAVILGCSEAPLLVTPENSKVPVYDATDILAEGAVRHAMV